MKNRLEEIRREHGLKQEELADILEVSRQTIGSLENGRYNPSIILAFKIARYFHMNIEDIFIYEEESECKKKEIKSSCWQQALSCTSSLACWIACEPFPLPYRPYSLYSTMPG